MKKILMAILGSGILFGAEYIVPQEYDNTINAVESSSRVLISNTSPIFSSVPKVIGGQNVRFRCVAVPKIDCRATTPRVIASTSEFSLREPTTNKLVGIFAYDTFSEDAGANWNVCGGAVGGTTWDDATMTFSDPVLTFTYDENANQDIYHFFTDIAPVDRRGGNGSFMVLEVKQVCI